MAKTLKRGDEVSWNTSQGRTQGKVVKRVTKTTHIKSHKAAASKEQPQYLVRSNVSGDKAVHKKRALKKI